MAGSWRTGKTVADNVEESTYRLSVLRDVNIPRRKNGSFEKLHNATNYNFV
jgi:hypothetical protein